MPEQIESPQSAPGPRRWLRRIGWMVLIWSASVAALGAAALALKLLMRLIGMSA
ncbi:DUF2474 domain-containing protein [Oxalobacteraceae bacterium CAVE-383]|nr:DUF2474 domain-containing protein [Oxalobacteraceae bacterium CAVE-383]